MDKTGAQVLHLRKHPDETGKWDKQLLQYLIANGINAVMVEADKPIKDIMCDYLGMVGFASGALRDARAACDYCYVIGFEGVSIGRYMNPRFVFGNSEGIDWIFEDGSFDEKIFQMQKFVPKSRKTLIEIIKEIA
jgi:hypothetical protein